ncbi:hypothetical protein [Thermomonas hydrothermalis]|nr:hypothetical protein [Thermomonas hydrothermalis]
MKIDSGMPNRISMNVSVAKQSQGATFGEKVNAGLQQAGNAVASGAQMTIDIACQADACVITFPEGDAIRADLKAMTLGPGAPQTGSQPAAQVGGVIPGAGIVSAVVSSGLSNMPGGTAASAGYARVSGQALPLSSKTVAPGRIDVTEPLAEGEYLLTLVVQPPAAAGEAPGRQVRIVQAFEVKAGRLKTKHDTAKNSISNIR